MAKEIIVPKLGLTMEDAYIKKILIKENDIVKKEDDLFEIETDKVTSFIQSEYDGKIIEILAEEEESYDIGEVLAIIDES